MASQALCQSPHIEVREAPRSPVWSLRQSRAIANADALARAFKAIGRAAPDRPNGLTGEAGIGSGWIEPHAWLIHGAVSATTVAAGLLLTEISDRVAAFHVSGAAAIDLIAAGCDPHMVSPGAMARTRFGGVFNVIIECWSENNYRLLVDVSIAHAFGAWLADAASRSASTA